MLQQLQCRCGGKLDFVKFKTKKEVYFVDSDGYIPANSAIHPFSETSEDKFLQCCNCQRKFEYTFGINGKILVMEEIINEEVK